MSYKFNPFSGNFDIVGSASGGTGDPGGSTTQVQFNDGGVFGGDSTFTFDKTTDTLTVANLATTGNTTLGDASGDTLTINALAVSIPNNLNFDSNTLFIDAANNWVGVKTTARSANAGDVVSFEVAGSVACNSRLIFNGSITGGVVGRLTEIANRSLRLDTFNGTDFNGTVTFAAQTLNFVTGTGLSVLERLRIDSVGNVGIGTPSPGAKLDVIGTIRFGTTSKAYVNHDGTNAQYVSEAGSTLFYTPVSTFYRWHINNVGQMTLDASGNLGIGATSFGTSAASVLGIKTGTAPSSGVADTIQLYSTDLSAGNTIPSIYTEGTGIVSSNTGTTNLSNRIAIRVNGTVYYLLAASAA